MKKTILLKSMLLLCALIVGSSYGWATDVTTSDFVLPTPQFSENFNSLSATSGTGNTSNATTLTSQTAFGIFDKIYCGKAENTWAIESNATFDSNVLSLSAVSASPVIASITGKTFGTKGAFSIKVLKTDKSMFGFYAADDGNAYAKANSSVYIQNTTGSLSINSGNGWVSIGSYTSDIIEILVVYNNTNSNDTYGNSISLASKKAHVYVNGTCVMDGANPKAFTIPGASLTAFRVLPQTADGNNVTIDDVNIYNSLPMSYTITPTVNDAGMGNVSIEGTIITATPNSGYRVKAGAAGYTVTSGTATVTNNGDNTFSVTPSSNCTVQINFEAIPTHTLSYAVSPVGTGSVLLSSTSVLEGSNATATADPNSGYVFDGWTISDGDHGASLSSATDNPTTVTMGTANATVTATFAAAYTITWNVNGQTIKTQAVKQNASLSTLFPEVSNLGGKAFRGWVKTSTVESDMDEGDLIAVASENATGNDTYYAVFATENSSKNEVTKLFGFETPSDVNWTIDGPTQSTDYKKSGTYSGYINSNHTYVTFKEKVNVTEFSFEFLRKTTNNNYNVYIETSTNGSSWTAVETYAMSSFASSETWYKRSHTFDGKSALYVRFHCYNTTADRFVDDVTIKYNEEIITYSDYSTSVTTAITPSYAKTTYVTPYKMNFSGVSGLKAYVATDAAASGVTMTLVEAAVPENTPLLLVGTKDTEYNVPVVASATAPETNLLKKGDGTTEFDGSTYDYILYSDGKFYQIGSGTVATTKAYLHLDSAPSAHALDIIFEESGEATGITEVSSKKQFNGEYYNLAGQRIAQPTKGLYIVNGKKFILK